jgi:UDP-N-acetylglucosamine 2-epimerase (non-hydrolysing)
VMIDTLLKHKELAGKFGLVERWGLKPDGFATLTLHRPSNVDDPVTLGDILDALSEFAKEIPVIFPIHPRTRKMVEQFGFSRYFSGADKPQGLWMTDPLSYLEFLHLNMNAMMVITDSGGLQEEATVLGIPCITLRNNTERPITCEVGTNFIVGNSQDNILHYTFKILNEEILRGGIPEKWDGKAAERIVEFLRNLNSGV